ncbi:MAG: leucyl aminopeptidase [Proteobacteria bacterium]|nr:leucyl aminopeptidase [Pseudomonadota bacterium]MCG2831494.1 leucyl aminopeptidase [Desulfobacteraceae bacterium]MBU3981110.1 leucyl aminopeptidase [Pseudomonadota bacterium]MBU4013107.1 leucyl aminopeptidase [Pseudomonadota bacterium]MBU4068413.1 leucyl aminopeptidase [Pseudomonadota bacterium]
MLSLKSVDLRKVKAETLAIPVCEDRDIHDDKIITSLITRAKKLEEFKGDSGEEVVFYNPPELKAERIILMGLGKLEKLNAESLRAFAGKAVKKCINMKLPEVLIVLPSAKKIKMEMPLPLEAIIEGACLGNHIFDKYKEEKKHIPLEKIDFLVTPDVAKSAGKILKSVTTICEGTIFARDLINTPSNDKKPEQFTKIIADIAEKENLKIKIFDEKELKQNKFGALLAVAAGSPSKPRMIILEYNPKGAKKTVALVGKGVTFDSGGINLKPTGSLDEMKSDMSGAAAVAATLIALAKLKPKIRVVGVIPVVENMLSGDATRPGDIVRSYSGKTVEILNTDAEGRLILIDAISYVVEKYKPETLIDIATLTGSCVVALGEKIAGVFSSDNKLAQSIVSSGEKTYERCWHMPLPDDYKEDLKSDFADLKNIAGSKWGGAITGALFLAEFVGDTKWAHIDIAGPSYQKKGSDYCGVGGTGFGVRLFCDLLEKL